MKKVWKNLIKEQCQRNLIGSNYKKYVNILTLAGVDCADIENWLRRDIIADNCSLIILEKNVSIVEKIKDKLRTLGLQSKSKVVNCRFEDYFTTTKFDLVNLDLCGSLNWELVNALNKLNFSNGADLYLSFSPPRGFANVFLNQLEEAIYNSDEGIEFLMLIKNKILYEHNIRFYNNVNRNDKGLIIFIMLYLILQGKDFIPSIDRYNATSFTKMNFCKIENIIRTSSVINSEFNYEKLKIAVANCKTKTSYTTRLPSMIKISKDGCLSEIIGRSLTSMVPVNKAFATRKLNLFKKELEIDKRSVKNSMRALLANITRKFPDLNHDLVVDFLS